MGNSTALSLSKLLAVLVVVVAGLSGLAGAAETPVPALVSVDEAKPGLTIPADFAGLSVEPCGDFAVCPPFRHAPPTRENHYRIDNTALIAAFRLIASQGILRMGGNSSDVAPPPEVTPAECRELGDFLRAVHWTLIYGLSAKSDDAATAAAQASCIASGVGIDRVVFQIGNEPELVSHLTEAQIQFQPWDKGVGEGAQRYYAMWKRYYAAVKAAVPGARFMGPDVHGPITLWPGFIDGVGAGSLAGLSMHQYPVGLAIEATSTIPNMVNTAVETSAVSKRPPPDPSYSAYAARIAGQIGVPYYLTEMNNIGYGGRDGVSNGLASGMWLVDYAMQLAAGGWAGFEVQGGLGNNEKGQPSGYAPLRQPDGIEVSPEFYALMMVGAVEGGQMLPTISPGLRGGADHPGAINVGGYGVKGHDGRVRIITVNRDIARAAAVTLAANTKWQRASILLLTGSDCAAKDEVTFGGARVTPAGRWTGTPISVANGASFVLPPCGAALATLQ
jgi:hypothetical protein